MNRFSLECRNLEFGYEFGKTVIRIDSMLINPGEITVFCGGNGTGKTTLMKLISGLLVPRKGEILCRSPGGRCLNNGVLRKNSIYVHQDPYILKGSVHQNLALLIPGKTGREREKLVSKALEITGLIGFDRKKASTLSGGEKKRLALSRALAAGKEILLLDEPTANVDAASSELLKNHLFRFRDMGMTIIIATHDMEFAEHTADLVYDFSCGRYG